METYEWAIVGVCATIGLCVIALAVFVIIYCWTRRTHGSSPDRTKVIVSNDDVGRHKDSDYPNAIWQTPSDDVTVSSVPAMVLRAAPPPQTPVAALIQGPTTLGPLMPSQLLPSARKVSWPGQENNWVVVKKVRRRKRGKPRKAKSDDSDSSSSDDMEASPLFKALSKGTQKELSFETACRQYPHFKHAAHCIVYARDDRILWNQYRIYADVLMQVRADGSLGFAGGFIEAYDNSIVAGLNRELVEELNVDLRRHRVTQNDHICSHVCSEQTTVAHFYGLEVTVSDYREIEGRALTAQEWGCEVFGILRVPLFTSKDGICGFPVFLKEKFIGHAKHQLVIALERRRIMPVNELRQAVTRSRRL